MPIGRRRAVAVIASGCVSGHDPGNRRSLFDCGELEGVFSSAGRNAKDAEQGLSPRSYTPLLTSLFDASDEPADLDAPSEFSVAIRHIGGGRLQVAILDRQGNTRESGNLHHFESCRNGVLRRVWTETLHGSDDLAPVVRAPTEGARMHRGVFECRNGTPQVRGRGDGGSGPSDADDRG